MRLKGMQLLFQLHQPSRCQVDILQHDPPEKHIKDKQTQRDECFRRLLSYRPEIDKLQIIPLRRTHLPDFTAVLIALSAWLNPSAEPKRTTLPMFRNVYLPVFRSIWSDKIYENVTNSNRGDLCVLLCRKVFNMSTSIIARYRAHQDRCVRLHLK